jgi:hypothetical protein
MARLLLIVCLATGLLAPRLSGAGEFSPQGQFVGRVDDRVTALLAQFPNGGPGLRAAIAFLLSSEPDLADDVIFAANNGSPGQKEAIGLGVADAAHYFARCISALCQIAEARLRQALIFADEPTRTAFTDGTNTNVTDIRTTPPIYIPGIGSSTNCMSQASPSGC